MSDATVQATEQAKTATPITSGEGEEGGSVLAGITSSEPKLWAGKYKTVEELENAYKNSARIYDENKELKAQVEKYTKVPDDYNIPDDIALREAEAKEIKLLAKRTGLTQDQCVNLAKEVHAKNIDVAQKFEEQKKALSEKDFGLLTDYVSTYPEGVRDVVMSKLIRDKPAREQAMNARNEQLNSKVPGINSAGGSGGGERYDGEQELINVAREVERNPRDQKLKEKYIRIANEVGEARGLGKKQG